jgi:hypothetical protein
MCLLVVVSSNSSSEKLQKATNKGRDWSDDATSLLLQGFGGFGGKCSRPLTRAISNKFTTILLTHLE